MNIRTRKDESFKPALFNYMKVKYDLLQESFNEIIDEAISRKYDDSNEDSFLI